MEKKILIITDYRSGGAGHVAKISGDILNMHKYDVQYLFGIDFFKFNLKNYLFNISGFNIVSRKIESYNPDIVMLHNFDNLWSPLILNAIRKYKKTNSNVKVLMTLHDYHIISATNSLTYYEGDQLNYFDKVPSLFELLKKRIDRRGRIYGYARILQWYIYYSILNLNSTIDTFICPSKFIMNKCVQRYKGGNVKVIYNPTKFVNTNNIKKVGKSLKILFAGRISKEKGILEFLKLVISSSVEMKRKIHFDIIGEGELLDELKELTEGTRSNIQIHGRKSHDFVESKLITSNFVLLPSTVFENAPLSLVEGTFKGCNLITMNYGGMKEIGEQLTSSIFLDELTQPSVDKVLKALDDFEDSSEYKKQRDVLAGKYGVEEYIKLIQNELN